MWRNDAEQWQTLSQCGSSAQFIEKFREELDKSPLRPGDRLPTIRVLTKISGLSANEVYRALQRLAAEEWVVQKRGAGTYVGPRKAQPSHSHSGGGNRIRRIGVVPPGWDPQASHEAVGATFHAIAMEASRKGHRVEIVAAAPEEYTKLEFADRILSLGLEGVIWIQPSYDFPLAILRLQEKEMPCVLTNRGFSGVNAPVVSMDFRHLGELVAEYLKANGRERLVALVGCRDDAYTRQVVLGLRAALQARGLNLPGDRLLTTRVGHQRRFYSLDLRRVVEEFFKVNHDFDSVFSLYPDALSTLFDLHHTGQKRCPDDYVHVHFIRSTLPPHLAWQDMPIAFVEPPSALVGMRAVQELERMWGMEPELLELPKAVLQVDPRLALARLGAM